MKLSPTLAGVVLLGTTLAACGGSDGGGGASGAGSGYCQEIAAAKPVFDSLSKGDLAQLEKGFQTFHDLADASPGDLEDEWKILDSAATSIEDALKSAGIEMADLAGIQSGQIPEGIDVTKLTSLAADLQKLNNDEFTKARTAITEQAKSSCDVDLGTL